MPYLTASDREGGIPDTAYVCIAKLPKGPMPFFEPVAE